MNHFFHPYTQQTTAMLCALACENAVQPVKDLLSPRIILPPDEGRDEIPNVDPSKLPPLDYGHPISGGEHDVVKDAIQEAIGGEES